MSKGMGNKGTLCIISDVENVGAIIYVLKTRAS